VTHKHNTCPELIPSPESKKQANEGLPCVGTALFGAFTPRGGRATISPVKTNATRRLDKLGIVYELRDYEVDRDDWSAIKVASQVGLPAQQVFKTLVAKGDVNGIALAVVVVDNEGPDFSQIGFEK
jgi:hypothetical protein